MALDPPELGHAETMEDSGPPGSQPGGPHVVAAADFEVVERSHYEIDAELARGGMGRILHAVDRRHGRMVAIKELLTDSPALRARFRREALITARLQHPAIVPVYEAGRWPSGEPFYAMKMVEGRSLDAVIADRPTLEQRMSLLPNVIAVAEAIAYAHERRVIHRDLKPANVLVGDFGETVVIDWGLAKDLARPEPEIDATEVDAIAPGSNLATGVVAISDVPVGVPAGLTVAGHAMGTPAFMSPEQARGEASDERADVYALGGILYHVLTGRVPYADSKADLDTLVTRKMLGEAPTPVTTLEAKVPPDLVAVVAKAMASSPDARYPTAKQLVDDLRRFETGQLVSVHDYSSAELFRRWLRRNRVVVGFATVLVAVLVVGGLLAITNVLRERNRATAALATAEVERARAEEQSRIAAEERTTAEHDREIAQQAQTDAVESRNQAQASAQALVEGWAQARFAASIRDCYRRGKRGAEASRHASLLLEVDDKHAIVETTIVRPFGTSADACLVAASRAWSFPPGTLAGEYSLDLMADADGDVQIGFAASDVDSIRRVMSRDYDAKVRLCYEQLLRTTPAAAGEVEATFTTGEDGETSIASLTSFAPALGDCVRKEIERWVFAPPRDDAGQPTTVTVAKATTLKPPPRVHDPVASRSPVASTGKGTAAPVPVPQTNAAPPAPVLDKDSIRRAIKRNLDEVTACYSQALSADPTLGGTVSTEFVIDADGTVTSVTASGLDDQVAGCVANVLRTIQFLKPGDGQPVKVNYPFTFRPPQD